MSIVLSMTLDSTADGIASERFQSVNASAELTTVSQRMTA